MRLKLTENDINGQELAKIIDINLQWILTKIKPLKIFVFGSAVEGNFKEGSDLDFLIVVSSKEQAKLSQKTLNKTKRPTDYPLDLVVLDLQSYKQGVRKGGLIYDISCNGQLLFEE